MCTIQKIGLHLYSGKDWPHKLTPSQVAELVDVIDGPLISGCYFPLLTQNAIADRIEAAEHSAWKIWRPRGVTAEVYRSVILRLWAGCITGAKIIAEGTRSGRNTKAIRKRGFRMLLWHCRRDGIYHDGARASILFKQRRNEYWSLAGGEKDMLREVFS